MGGSIDFRETFADLARNTTEHLAGKLHPKASKLRQATSCSGLLLHSCGILRPCFPPTDFSSVCILHTLPASTHGSTPHFHGQQLYFYDLLRETLAEGNTKTKRSPPSYLNTRTFRTTPTCMYSYDKKKKKKKKKKKMDQGKPVYVKTFI